MEIKNLTFTRAGAPGPCAKTRVSCEIISPFGEHFFGTNDCNTAQPVCPRAPGEGYDKCKSVCAQPGHAEDMAARAAGRRAVGGEARLTGHTYACDNCKAALRAVGITRLLVNGVVDASYSLGSDGPHQHNGTYTEHA